MNFELRPVNRGGQTGRYNKPRRGRGERGEGFVPHNNNNNQNGGKYRDVDPSLLPDRTYEDIDSLAPAALLKEAKAFKLDAKSMDRDDVVEQVFTRSYPDHVFARGVLEIARDGNGALRKDSYEITDQDPVVSQSLIKKNNLRPGDTVFGVLKPNEGNERPILARVESVNRVSALGEAFKKRKNFEDFTPDFPREKLIMETSGENIPQRIIDLISPIGKGQRGLIVSPPKAGKTTMLKAIANAIVANHPEVYLMLLLVDERPEEVTDMRRSVRAQVVYSTFDKRPENHMRVADLCLEQAKRLVENGKDVVILLDSLTRLSRASNLTVPNSGKTLSGGLDPAALYGPRRFFGAARNIEEGGSLTIVSSVLVDTGSKMDEAIFEELKGTGNMEVVLDRDLAERRIWPAVDVKRSSTRHEELLFDKNEYQAVVQLHRLLANTEKSVETTESFIKMLKRTPTNAAFLETIMARVRASQTPSAPNA